MKVTLVLDEADADLLYSAARSGAVAWSLQGRDDDAKGALALAERVKSARRHSHRGAPAPKPNPGKRTRTA